MYLRLRVKFRRVGAINYDKHETPHKVLKETFDGRTIFSLLYFSQKGGVVVGEAFAY